MPYNARVFRILVSCPGDVTAIRDVAIEVVHEWNYVYSESVNIMLHPVAWDTHVSPGSGATAQALIDKAVVEACDLLVGIFWTRFGTPTDKYGSGTEEEIEAFWSSGRQAMIYFSDERIAPSHFMKRENKRQYERVLVFRRKAQRLGLVATFSDAADFRRRFKEHLAHKILELTDALTT